MTGLILWQNRRFPFPLVSQANLIHQYLAYIALLVFMGHFYLSAVHPATRRSLSGILSGGVDRAWASHHHPNWQPNPGRELPFRLANAIRSLAILVVALEAALLLARVGFEWLGANGTDPVIRLIYRFSAMPGTEQTSAGVHRFDIAAVFWFGLVLALVVGMVRGQHLLPGLNNAAS